MDQPPTDSPNILRIDYGNSPDLKQLLAGKDIGDECELKLKLSVISKDDETITLSVDKVISDYETENGEDEVTPSDEAPIMMGMKRKKKGMMGPNNRPPQPVENPTEPYLTSYT